MRIFAEIFEDRLPLCALLLEDIPYQHADLPHRCLTACRRDKPDSRPQTPPEAIFSPQVVRRHSAWRRCSFAIWALILDNRNQPDDDWLFCYRDFPIHFQCKLRETLSLREKALPNGVAIYLNVRSGPPTAKRPAQSSRQSTASAPNRTARPSVRRRSTPARYRY